MSTTSIVNFDSSILLGYYQAKLSAAAANTSGQSSAATPPPAASSSKTSPAANDVTPWSSATATPQEQRDAQVLGTANFIDLSKVPILSGTTKDSLTEQDNQKLFALYNAVNKLSYLAVIAKRDGETTGQMTGLNTRFQAGLKQIENFISTATFNNFTLQAAAASSSTTGTASVPFAVFGYSGGTIVSDANIAEALPGVSAGDNFTVSVTKGGQRTDVAIDLSQIPGDLTIDNIVNYVNQQLKAAGFSSRFQRAMTEGTIDDIANASYGIEITPAPGESLSLSSAASSPALYVASTAGLTTATADSAVDSQGRLVKLTNLSDPEASFSQTVAPGSGTTTAASTVVDANGNVYMVGNATGSFGSQLNQGSQDVYLTKYDSAGNLQWTKLLGSAGTAAGTSLALVPGGGVVVTGSTDADLTTAAVADGNTDSFVAKYDAGGTQLWTTQLQTLNTNRAAAVSVDASGNVYIGGQTTGAIGKGQTKIGGSDAYLAKLDSKGNVVAERQFGSTANDTVAATALTGSGDLVVASVQNGEAILAKYAGGDVTAAPVWTLDLGALQNGGSLSGLAVSGNRIYVSGTTQNGALNAAVASPASGGGDAFVLSATDNGTGATAGNISYVGTDGIDKAGAVTVGPDGTVYLAGSTGGTFAGQQRSTTGTTNAFVAALAADGSLRWVRQYGGTDGQSAGQGIAVDAQGSSVLDALGLPRGAITLSQSSDLASATTLRAGDSFQVQIQGTAARSFTVAIDRGETLQSLVTKINGELGSNGTASIAYGAGGAALKIAVGAGVTAKLVAGPADFDALGRLGLTPGTLSNPASDKSASGSASSGGTSPSSTQSFALGLAANMDLSTAAGAGAARAQLLSVLSAVQKIYQTTNTPASGSAAAATQSGGTVPAYLQSQLAGYNLALSILTPSTSASSTSLFG